MRLSSLYHVATLFLLMEQFTHTVVIGFSIFPTASTLLPTRRTTTTSTTSLLALSSGNPPPKGGEAELSFHEQVLERARKAAAMLEELEEEDDEEEAPTTTKPFHEQVLERARKASATMIEEEDEALTKEELLELEETLEDANNDMQTILGTSSEKRVKIESKEAVAPASSAPAPTVSTPVAKEVSSLTPEQREDLRTAVSNMDTAALSKLLAAGLEMDEETTNMAFWAVVEEVDRAESQDQPLSANVPRMLHHIFDADLKHLLQREKQTTNVTCMQPKLDSIEARAQAMNYIFDDSSHKDLPLEEGRRCEDGLCCDECSRNIFPTFAAPEECSFETFPELASLTFNDLKSVSAKTILQFTRLVERVRRTMSHEYGLPLSSLLPLQAYSRKYVAGTTQKGGGGGEGDFVTLHTDEATHSGYHYSCVLYLSEYGEDFEGGAFVFNDPAKKDSSVEDKDDEDDYEQDYATLAEAIRKAGRKLTPFYPTRGSAVIFSSGWENMHEVEKITSGTRYTVPCFFTTCPVPDVAYEQMVCGKPKSDEDIADDWLHLLLAHRSETPLESTGRVKELLMKWHYMCTPLSEH